MNRNFTLSAFLLSAIIMVIAPQIKTDPVTNYMYLSDLESTPNREIIWFWTQDSLYGTVRSNDFIGLKFSPHFYGRVMTAQDDFLYYIANPWFRFEPMFNCNVHPFPHEFGHLEEMANETIDGNGLMTRLHFSGDEGINVYKYRTGNNPPPLFEEDSVWQNIELDEDKVIQVNGQCEVYGVLDGRTTIHSTHDLWLVDNIIYDGANETDGSFNWRRMDHMLGLVSSGDIIIRNNTWNGKEDGYGNYAADSTNRHSISINASLIALGESFTFQHQNDDWEAYQGPNPDKRGRINLWGSLAQKRRGYVHRSNHAGTGYYKNYHYDYRLENEYPPGLEPGHYLHIFGDYDRLELRLDEHNISHSNINSLFVTHPADILLNDSLSLVITDTLVLHGSEDQQVVIRGSQLPGAGKSWIFINRAAFVSLRHAKFLPNVGVQFIADSLEFINSRFSAEVNIDGDCVIENSWFEQAVSISSFGKISVEKNCFEGGMVVRGDPDEIRISNNTIVGADVPGILLHGFDQADISNNIIAFNYSGVDNRHWRDIRLGFNNIYSNMDRDYLDCEAGEGSISENPVFRDLAGREYSLRDGSPCIDAGDPDSPNDPDGSRRDIGAFPYQHNLHVRTVPVLESRLLAAAYPNPFNDELTLKFNTNIRSADELQVIDITGRIIFNRKLSTDDHGRTVTINASSFGNAGVYIVRVKSEDRVDMIKVTYLR